MDNSFYAVIIPGAISGFNLMVMKSFFASLPNELIDSSRIDGCNEIGLLFRIVLPLAKPSLAAVGLFYGVGNWNSLQGPLIYLRNAKLYTLQIRLFQMIQSNQTEFSDILANYVSTPQTIKATTIVVATLPILIVYPFLQKYFVQGATLGSIKE
jgi:ABC-type sugar transport system, permease component